MKAADKLVLERQFLQRAGGFNPLVYTTTYLPFSSEDDLFAENDDEDEFEVILPTAEECRQIAKNLVTVSYSVSVCNIAFRVTMTAVRQFFEQFGKIRHFEMPQHYADESHKGWAYITYFDWDARQRALRADFSPITLDEREVIVRPCHQRAIQSLSEKRTLDTSSGINKRFKYESPEHLGMDSGCPSRNFREGH